MNVLSQRLRQTDAMIEDLLFLDVQLARRTGFDLLAALGSGLEIPLLDGRHQLEIAAGTQPGDVIRLRGKGMPDPHSRRKGDLLVQVMVEVPKNLTPRQEELLRELAEIENTHVTPERKSFFAKLKDYFQGG